MGLAKFTLTAGAFFFALACSTPRQAATGWDQVKREQTPHCDKPQEFEAPYRQPIANMAWQDGLYISRDGLALYCTYIPSDLLQFAFSGLSADQIYRFQRGPTLGIDFSNPLGKDTPWVHSDIAVATRKSVEEPFGPWQLSKLQDKYFNLGGAVGDQNKANPSKFDYFAYTYDAENGPKVYLMRNVARDLAPHEQGVSLPSNINDPRYHTDNPHIERVASGRLVLFWDSDNRPGLGGRDIFYSMSADDGSNWSDPRPVTTVNTQYDDEQPHLFDDGQRWWLYFTGSNPADSKLAIYRCVQEIPGIRTVGDGASW